MKILKKKNKSLYGGGAAPAPAAGGVVPWAITDRSQFRTLAKASKTEGLRAPEFWLSEDDRKTIRFVDPDAVASFRAYNIKRNGRYDKIVAPKEGDPDLLASELNLRPQTYFVFRIIDVDGYTPKSGKNAGKKVTNSPKFYVVGARIYEQIRLQCVDTTGEPLNAGNVVACRSGSGQNTVYTFIPRPGSLTPAMKQAIAKFPKWYEFYKPLSLKQQQALVNILGVPTDNTEE